MNLINKIKCIKCKSKNVRYIDWNITSKNYTEVTCRDCKHIFKIKK